MNEFDELLRRLRRLNAVYCLAEGDEPDAPCLGWWIAWHDNEEIG